MLAGGAPALNRLQGGDLLVLAAPGGMALTRTDAAVAARALRNYLKLEDDALLQATHDYYSKYFHATLHVPERSIANMLQSLDHPGARTADPKQFFDNSLVDEIGRQAAPRWVGGGSASEGSKAEVEPLSAARAPRDCGHPTVAAEQIMMDRVTLHSPPGGPTHGRGMVPGVQAGGFIFFSAIRGAHPTTREMSDDTAEQARQALENLRVLVEAAGGTLRHVVKVTLYLHDLKYRSAFHQVWMEYFPEDPPARIAIQVADANASPGGRAHFALDVIALAP